MIGFTNFVLTLSMENLQNENSSWEKNTYHKLRLFCLTYQPTNKEFNVADILE